MTDTHKVKKVANALVTLTDRGDLPWEEVTADSDIPEPEAPPEGSPVYFAHQGGMDLFLYEAEADDPPHLEVAKPKGSTGWAFPAIDELNTLYDLVQFRTSGLEEWMDAVIEEAEAVADDELTADEPDAQLNTPEEDPGGPPWNDPSDEEPRSDEPVPHDEAGLAEEETDASSEPVDESDVFEPGGDGTASENNFV